MWGVRFRCSEKSCQSRRQSQDELPGAQTGKYHEHSSLFMFSDNSFVQNIPILFHSKCPVRFRFNDHYIFPLEQRKEISYIFSVVRENINKACDIAEGDTGQKDYC